MAPKSATPRPVTALDNRQLDLPLFAGPADDGALAPLAPLVESVPPRQDPTPSGVKLRRLTLSGRTVEYALKRSSRRTIGFSIDGNGLTITAPRWVTLADIETAIAGKERWIFAKLSEWQTRTEQRALPRIEWRDGAQIPYLGKPVRIVLAPTNAALVFDAQAAALSLTLPAHADAQQIKDRVQGWLQTEAKRVFGERLAYYADKLGVAYKGYALSAAATRWGSCSSDGRIRLNWRLIHFPLSIIDYVVAHELAHLREMNHSPRFWETVESIFPEFREARHTLKHHPPELLPTL
ncbi:M48 family metallopeptidase [Trinickia acidisoli]|uniref:M48 family metallopeptidase n=1 Tax=Trinickia acidisoli TaxID=2767482 RepID=UPI001A8C9C8F|nr:SprT family zinc-dependent metalloprotease [Trinickia acidisoli]